MPDGDRTRITPYRNGPLLVRGDVVVRDHLGREIPTDRQPLALCRCGRSQLKPFCDGTHKLIGFTAPSRPERDRAPRGGSAASCDPPPTRP